MILVVSLPDLRPLAQWPLPSGGAHGLDIDHSRERLYAACDAGDLVEVDSRSGEVTNVWPISGPPDVTFFNPATGRVHVAIGEPGLVETIDPKTRKTMHTVTGADAHTTVLVPPDRLYVISPAHGESLYLRTHSLRSQSLNRRSRMGRAKAKPINSVRGGATCVAGAPPILRADRDCSQRAVECAVTSTPPTVATNPREAAASIAGGPPAIAVVASRPRTVGHRRRRPRRIFQRIVAFRA